MDGVETSEELHFFYDAQSRPAMVEYNGAMYSYLHNLQGDIIGIVDSSGNLVVEYKYDAWGKPIYEAGSLLSTLGNLNPFRYRGYVWDEETELYYLRSRFVLTQILRFINADLNIGNATVFGHNIFTYCINNPVSFDDQTGKSAQRSVGPRSRPDAEYREAYARRVLENGNGSTVQQYKKTRTYIDGSTVITTYRITCVPNSLKVVDMWSQETVTNITLAERGIVTGVGVLAGNYIKKLITSQLVALGLSQNWIALIVVGCAFGANIFYEHLKDEASNIKNLERKAASDLAKINDTGVVYVEQTTINISTGDMCEQSFYVEWNEWLSMLWE